MKSISSLLFIGAIFYVSFTMGELNQKQKAIKIINKAYTEAINCHEHKQRLLTVKEHINAKN